MPFLEPADSDTIPHAERVRRAERRVAIDVLEEVAAHVLGTVGRLVQYFLDGGADVTQAVVPDRIGFQPGMMLAERQVGGQEPGRSPAARWKLAPELLEPRGIRMDHRIDQSVPFSI